MRTLEVLSLAIERLARAIGMQHKVSPRKEEDWLDKREAVLRSMNDPFIEPGGEKPYLPPKEPEDRG